MTMSAPALLDGKLAHAFKQLDVNQNGQIELDDLLELGNRVLTALKVAPESADGRALAAAYEQLWGALVREADTNHDGMLSPQEYVTAMRSAFFERHGGFDEAFRPAATITVKLADADGDGAVTPRDFEILLSAFQATPADAELAFGHLDTDGDGTLSVDELIEAARHFYAGDDPDAPGNWLFGRIDT